MRVAGWFGSRLVYWCPCEAHARGLLAALPLKEWDIEQLRVLGMRMHPRDIVASSGATVALHLLKLECRIAELEELLRVRGGDRRQPPTLRATEKGSETMSALKMLLDRYGEELLLASLLIFAALLGSAITLLVVS
jgi:hypothetical protein